MNFLLLHLTLSAVWHDMLFIVGRNLVCTLARTKHMLKWMASRELATKNSSQERKLFKHSMVMDNL